MTNEFTGFNYQKINDIHVHTLDDKEKRKFLSDITAPFRHCYVIDSELSDKAAISKIFI
jgi:hypothetical protein